ncbi:substrate-binding periplasmic protein [Pseudomonas sp. LRF_L74]|uniref:substrate-binding periplasmic protein n=1 Tax=Pseudomonas sp. LRF_L74 TaxID=3369422 RepID=UPI003F5FDF43
MGRHGCAVLLAMALLAMNAARGETLVIAGDTWCPINCASDSSRPGIFVELARQIFGESGIDVRYDVMNWARTLQQVRAGTLNAAIGAGVADAPDFLFTSTPVAQSRFCFYTLKDSTWRFKGLGSLAGKRIGVINDYSYGDVLNGYIDQNKGNDALVQKAAGLMATDLNLLKLQRRRIDAALENVWVMRWALAEHGIKPLIREAGCREQDQPIYLAFSPALESSKRYAELFESGLRRYRKDGRLQQLLRNYGVAD